MACAPITRTVGGIRSEVEVGPEQGLPVPGVISCDTLLTVPQVALDPTPVGHLEEVKRAQLDRALPATDVDRAGSTDRLGELLEGAIGPSARWLVHAALVRTELLKP